MQGYRAILGPHGHHGAPGEIGQRLLEEGGIAQGGGHQEEAGLFQDQKGNLPGRPPVAVGVIMELVHDHVEDGAGFAFGQGHIGQNLGGAAEDGRVAVDRGVAGGEPHVLGTEFPAEREPLLVDQGLDGAGIDRTAALGEGLEMQDGSHQGLARARRRVEDDVLAFEELQRRRLLGRIQGNPL
jgi:hypothetical protein